MAWSTPPTFTVGQILTAAQVQILSDNSAFEHVKPVIHVQTGAAVALANSTTATVDYDAEGFKRDITHSTGANPDRVTIVTAGIYLITYTVNFADNATGRRYGSVVLNGGSVIRQVSVPAVNGADTSVSLSFSYQLAASDYLSTQIFQTSGGALNTYPWLEVTWVAHYP